MGDAAHWNYCGSSNYTKLAVLVLLAVGYYVVEVICSLVHS